jgi:enterochelin esterase-like enzyme
MDAGRYEGLLESNRYMNTLLKDKNYTIKFHEYSEGHNFTAWRDDFLRGLETLFRYRRQRDIFQSPNLTNHEIA